MLSEDSIFFWVFGILLMLFLPGFFLQVMKWMNPKYSTMAKVLLADFPKMLKSNRAVREQLVELDKKENFSPSDSGLCGADPTKGLEAVNERKLKNEKRFEAVRDRGKLSLIGITVGLGMSFAGIKATADLASGKLLTPWMARICFVLIVFSSLYCLGAAMLAIVGLDVAEWAESGLSYNQLNPWSRLGKEMLNLEWNQRQVTLVSNYTSTSLGLLLRGVMILATLTILLGLSALIKLPTLDTIAR